MSSEERIPRVQYEQFFVDRSVVRLVLDTLFGVSSTKKKDGMVKED